MTRKTSERRNGNIAIYHLSIKIISRGKGKSAVAAAAYRAGEKITNEYDGITHDYSRKKGVIHTEILLPENAPSEYQDRYVLWNEVEKIEKSKNSQLAREIEIALPREFTKERNISLAREFVKKEFVDKGMCADVCIHDTGTGNPHAHIMLTMRPFNEDTTWGAKSKKEYVLDKNGEKIKLKSGEYKSVKVSAVDWNDKDKAEVWRAAWADEVNTVLSEKVDHRSYKRQGKDEIPTIHLGAAAHQMEQRGIQTERGNINRNIKINNREIKELKKQLYQIEKWLKKQEQNHEPTLAEVIENAVKNRVYGTSEQKVYALTKAAKIVNFITDNGIEDYGKLHGKIDKMYERLYEVRTALKSAEARLKELGEDIKQGEIYRSNKAVYEQYKTIRPNLADKLLKRDPKADFYEANRAEITLFQTAERHLKKHLKAGAIPLNKWREETAKLTVEKDRLYGEYYVLKEEVKAIDDVKREVDGIMRIDMAEQRENRREWGVER